MNGVDDMLYMQSTNGNDGIDAAHRHVRHRHRSEHRPGERAEPPGAGAAEPADRGHAVRLHDAQVHRPADDAGVAVLAEQHATTRCYLANYANINIVDALYRVTGVGDVRIFGAGEYAMRIWLQPDRLATMAMTVPEVARAVQAAERRQPGGPDRRTPRPARPGVHVHRPRAGTSADAGGVRRRSSCAPIRTARSCTCATSRASNSAPSTTSRSAAPTASPACGIAVFQAPGSNALDVAAGVREVMTELRSRFPEDVDYRYTLDTTAPVSEGIKEITKTLVEAMVLVILVVFLFLQNWRATLIPMLAVPVSLIGTFAVFPLLGFSINTLSLFGLVLAIGLVVDDAIVVVEAVEQHIEHGMSPRDATAQGDEGSVGSGHRHRADPGVGVRAGRPDGRHPGPVEPAVRHHHRGLGAHLGVQRADAVAGAGGDAAAAAATVARPARPLLRRRSIAGSSA